jgi:hypothetical protein
MARVFNAQLNAMSTDELKNSEYLDFVPQVDDF